MKITEIMRYPVVVVRKNATLEEAAQLMLTHNLRGLPVVDEEGKICGFITVSDYIARDERIPFTKFRSLRLFGSWVMKAGIERIYESARNIPVEERMSTPPLTVTEDASVEEVVELMVHNGLNRIPVVRNGVPVGIVARYDLLKMMIGRAGASKDCV